jgi:hypothetical protein
LERKFIIETISGKRNAIAATNELLNDNIKLDVNREYQNTDYSKKRIAVFEKSAEQANENYRITKINMTTVWQP